MPALAQRKKASALTSTACNCRELRAKRQPVRTAAAKRSAGSSASTGWRFQDSSTRITPKNDAAFSAKVSHGPTRLTSIPASAGPMARDTLRPTLERATAAGSSSLSTRSGVSALHAGIISAVPIPRQSVSESSETTPISPLRESRVSATATADIHSCTPTR
ncbi:hypothetical protein D3C78_1068750 [compost metagenome]